jgi:hypothetical protein
MNVTYMQCMVFAEGCTFELRLMSPDVIVNLLGNVNSQPPLFL